MVVIGIAVVVTAMAIFQIVPALKNANTDTAARQMVDQIRQAREYSIENRRYVEIQFNTDVNGRTEIVTTQKNSQTANAGNDVVLNTVYLQQPATYCVCGMPDTPEAYGNSAAVYFGGTANGPGGSGANMWFESDGQLVSGVTLQPINGTVFLGVTNQMTLSRAITVLGTTGRVRSYRSTGSQWVAY